MYTTHHNPQTDVHPTYLNTETGIHHHNQIYVKHDSTWTFARSITQM